MKKMNSLTTFQLDKKKRELTWRSRRKSIKRPSGRPIRGSDQTGGRTGGRGATEEDTTTSSDIAELMATTREETMNSRSSTDLRTKILMIGTKLTNFK